MTDMTTHRVTVWADVRGLTLGSRGVLRQREFAQTVRTGAASDAVVVGAAAVQ